MARNEIHAGGYLRPRDVLVGIWPHRMHEIRTIAINNPVAFVSVSQSVCLSVTLATVLRQTN